MGYENDRATLALKLADLIHALALECFVADGQHLIDKQDVGVGVHRDRERQTHVHARRVELDLRVDEIADLGERNDAVEALVCFLARQSKDRRVQVHVVSSGQIRVETRSEFEQRSEPSPAHDTAL